MSCLDKLSQNNPLLLATEFVDNARHGVCTGVCFCVRNPQLATAANASTGALVVPDEVDTHDDDENDDDCEDDEWIPLARPITASPVIRAATGVAKRQGKATYLPTNQPTNRVSE